MTDRERSDSYCRTHGHWWKRIGAVKWVCETVSSVQSATSMTSPASAVRDGGYQGSADPGEPTMLMQPQTKPVKANAESGISDELVKRGARAQVTWLSDFGYSRLSDHEREKYEYRARLVLEAVRPESLTSDEARALLTLQGGPVRYTDADLAALDSARVKLKAIRDLEEEYGV